MWIDWVHERDMLSLYDFGCVGIYIYIHIDHMDMF